MKRIVFDLDDTLCFPNHEAKDTETKYGLAKPNDVVINRLQMLKQNGYYVIINTARRMLTHNGDLSKIKADVEDITINWLDKYNVPYDELVFGKPYADTYYVDDKAMNIEGFLKWTNSTL